MRSIRRPGTMLGQLEGEVLPLRLRPMTGRHPKVASIRSGEPARTGDRRAGEHGEQEMHGVLE